MSGWPVRIRMIRRVVGVSLLCIATSLAVDGGHSLKGDITELTNAQFQTLDDNIQSLDQVPLEKREELKDQIRYARFLALGSDRNASNSRRYIWYVFGLMLVALCLLIGTEVKTVSKDNKPEEVAEA